MEVADITAIVLAGGRSRRLGRDKALEVFKGQTLLARVIQVLAPISREVLVVVARDQPASRVPPHPAVRTVVDLLPDRGPLVGLYTGLRASRCTYNLVVGCDMPFLNARLLRFLGELAPGYDAVIPRVAGKPQPLHGVYNRSCLTVLEGLVHKVGLGPTDLLPLLKVKYVEEPELQTLDPGLRSLFNINEEEDLERALEVAKVEGII